MRDDDTAGLLRMRGDRLPVVGMIDSSITATLMPSSLGLLRREERGVERARPT